MSNTVIKVTGFGKQYNIGSLHRKQQYDTLRDRITDGFKSAGKHIFHRTKIMLGSEKFWALRDISFEVKEGEILGIIGKNGAGKSTLLRMLCKITSPTEGRAIIKGRVGSLLEVGTGFHQELTGRENIYFSGAILGMKKVEIDRKLDEIIDFSGVEQFIDTPVKRYSSGMRVRLGFAVAAHLEPEILLIDEVLAVGDADFQKKCLGKMSTVAGEGRTILFVSHNMAAVNRLCTKGMVLEEGRMAYIGTAEEATRMYYGGDLGNMAETIWIEDEAPGDTIAKLRAVRIIDEDGKIADVLDIRNHYILEMEFRIIKPEADIAVVFSFIDELGNILFVSPDWHEKKWGARKRPKGMYKTRCHLPGNLFAEGMVSVVAEVSTRKPIYQIHFLQYNSVVFQVVDEGYEDSVRGGWGRNMPGFVRPMLEWETEYLGEMR